jgi:hypothetical protein
MAGILFWFLRNVWGIPRQAPSKQPFPLIPVFHRLKKSFFENTQNIFHETGLTVLPH